MNKHVKKAMELRDEQPMVHNCAQTIMCAYADELGLSEDMAGAIGSNFGGGMKNGSVCGAITSALMVLGAKGIDDPAKINQFRKTIANNHEGNINCVDLLRANAAKGGDKKTNCDCMIKEAIELIDSMENK